MKISFCKARNFEWADSDLCSRRAMGEDDWPATRSHPDSSKLIIQI